MPRSVEMALVDEAWSGGERAFRGEADLRIRRPGLPDGPEALVFVHIPKCAGSSFRQVLKRWFGENALFIDTHDPEILEVAVERAASTPRSIAGHTPFGLHQNLQVSPCYVSLVRHPLDRFVSLYRHARRTPGHAMHVDAVRLDLEAFYDFTLSDPRAQGRMVAVQCYFLSRSRSFEETRAVIDQHYALVAPTERYGEFVAALAERFRRRPQELEPRNVGEDGLDIEAARAALEPRIRTDHAEDLKLFTYVSERFDGRRESFLSAPRTRDEASP